MRSPRSGSARVPAVRAVASKREMNAVPHRALTHVQFAQLARFLSDQHYYRGYSHLGSLESGEWAGAASGAVLGAKTATSTGSIVAGSVAGGLMMAAAFDPEPISKAILAIGAALTGFVTQMFQGCGQTCIIATQTVNQIEPYLQRNLDMYMSAPVHYRSVQEKALAVFDTGWDAVLRGCGNPQLGDAGVRCINERKLGGEAPWCPTADHKGCDWWTLYRLPIANDPNVVDDPVPPSILEGADTSLAQTGQRIADFFGFNTPGTSTGSGMPSSLTKWLLPAGLFLAAVVLVSSIGDD